MKKLRNILASFICVFILVGCQATMSGIHKKSSGKNEYIPSYESKQLQRQYEEPKIDGDVVGNTIKIAILVPLSGSYKDLGQGLVNAAQLAIFKIGDRNLTLLPIDTKDSPAAAVSAAQEAIAQGAKIILGPVFSNGAKAIAKLAAENDIQVVSFSNDKSLANTGVFAIGLMPEQQANRIVNYAIEKGIKNFAALLPSDTYGTIVTKELQQAAKEHADVSIIKNEVYQADSQGRVISLDDKVKVVADAIKSGTPTAPRGVLLSAGAVSTGQIIAALVNRNNIDKSKVQFLGTDQWNENSILTNPALEGAWFTALPFERRRDFENKYREIYGHDAPKLSGLAYDGIALAATVVKHSGNGTFSRDALTNPRGFIGVDGIFRLHDNGLAERGYAVMLIKGGHAVVIDPAPKSFNN